ncbi:MAG: FAD-dependent oxidoreductase [Candidatus Eremiobacteraeota bacterium]|nr:FAD-dependent oxidoreductase [Candidatus Eremiobacteraeota bacterium]
MESIDIVIIGAGVVGAAISHDLVQSGYQAIVLERARIPASAASGSNAGILASGFNRAHDMLETRLMRSGARRWPEVCERLRIPYKKTGALVLAQTSQDVQRFPSIIDNATNSGIVVEALDSGHLRSREPGARGCAALLVAEEGITDPFEVTRRLLGCVPVHYEARVTAVEQRGADTAIVRVGTAIIAARVVINCAGLYGDEVAADGTFSITPRRGDFVVYAPTAPPKLEHILRPIDPAGGVLVFPTMYGYLCAGPSSVEQSDKEEYQPRALRDVREQAARLLPILSAMQPVDAWAGLRPAGSPHDTIIGWSPRVSAMLNVGAIRGTGLSSCLGISEYVLQMLAQRDIRPRGRQLACPESNFDAPRPWWERQASERQMHARTSGGAAQIE